MLNAESTSGQFEKCVPGDPRAKHDMQLATFGEEGSAKSAPYNKDWQEYSIGLVLGQFKVIGVRSAFGLLPVNNIRQWIRKRDYRMYMCVYIYSACLIQYLFKDIGSPIQTQPPLHWVVLFGHPES